MADAEAAKQGEETPKKKGPPLLTIGVVAAMMAAEGVGVYVLVGLTRPASSKASQIEIGELDPGEQLMEVKLLQDRFQNQTTGRVWQWEVELVLKVKQKNVEHVTKLLEARAAEVKEGIGKIVSSALHRQLSEPGRSTLDRQITAYAAQVFGADAEGAGRVEDVLIPTLRGNPADF